MRCYFYKTNEPDEETQPLISARWDLNVDKTGILKSDGQRDMRLVADVTGFLSTTLSNHFSNNHEDFEFSPPLIQRASELKDSKASGEIVNETDFKNFLKGNIFVLFNY